MLLFLFIPFFYLKFVNIKFLQLVFWSDDEIIDFERPHQKYNIFIGLFVFKFIYKNSNKLLEAMNTPTYKSSQLNKLHQLKQKVRLIQDDIRFLKSCKKNKLFPSFIKINTSVKNHITDKVIHNAKVNWLNLEIKYLYAKQSNFELQALELHLSITKTLSTIEYPFFQTQYNYMLESIEFKHIRKEEKLNRKFTKLI